MFRRRRPARLADRGPLKVMFVITSMPVGGAETLLVELIRRLDRERFAPELCCLKDFGPLGELLAREIPACERLISHKYDAPVLGRLTRLMKKRRIDAVVTVGTGGDKMFWGRLAAWRAGVPVILSSLHSTGLPDRVERLNRLLVPLTDGFIAVAEAHARYLVASEGCPARRTFVVPNGVDVQRFQSRPALPRLRQELDLPPGSPVAAIVAALRPEKDHELFLRVAARIAVERRDARFLIIGDGPRRSELEALAAYLGISPAVRFLGSRSDVPEILALADVFVLTSKMEASPVSILEAMACRRPVVVPHVGSIPETVVHGQTGFLVPPGDERAFARRLAELFADPATAERMGRAGRQRVVERYSVEAMVTGYQDLIAGIYRRKSGGSADLPPRAAAVTEAPRPV